MSKWAGAMPVVSMTLLAEKGSSVSHWSGHMASLPFGVCVCVRVIVLLKQFPVCETWTDTSQTVDKTWCAVPRSWHFSGALLDLTQYTDSVACPADCLLAPRIKRCKACCKSLLADDIPPRCCRWVCVCGKVGVPPDCESLPFCSCRPMWGMRLMNETWLLKSGWQMRLMVES